MNTFYANAVSLKLTKNELLLEFYSHFPDNPGQGLSPTQEPEARVVMAAQAIQQLAMVFRKAAEQGQNQKAEQGSSIGFKATADKGDT